jgi:hypothetical protein
MRLEELAKRRQLAIARERRPYGTQRRTTLGAIRSQCGGEQNLFNAYHPPHYVLHLDTVTSPLGIIQNRPSGGIPSAPYELHSHACSDSVGAHLQNVKFRV